ncbi:MAG: inositol monophosphatase family protein [Candidatus Bathyarchaeia archaeon]
MASSKIVRWLPILRGAAAEARKNVGRIARNSRGLGLNELKNLLDSEAEASIESYLENVGENATIISEEGELVIGSGGSFIIVDPVDGTTNLAKGIPFAVTSLAASDSQRFLDETASIVMDIRTGRCFTAERSKRARIGGMRLKPSEDKPLDQVFLSVDVSKTIISNPLCRLMGKVKYLRQFGCSALALCLVASGVVDAHIDVRGTLRATDIAAGLMILKEAGGAYSINGVVNGDFELSRDSRLKLVAASTPSLLEKILGMLS